MRDLRLSSAASSLATSSRIRSSLAPSSTLNTKTKTFDEKEEEKGKKSSSYKVVPARTLNIVNVSSRNWAQKVYNSSNGNKENVVAAEEEPKKKETKKVRKRREWMQRKLDGEGKTIKKKANKYCGDWTYLPDIVLEKIFQYLPFEEKMRSSQVCRYWARIVHCRSIWADFVVHDLTLTQSRFNFAGKFYEEVIDHAKASAALNRLAFKIKHLSFLPRKNLHNICSFQEMMTRFCTFYGTLPNIESFCYVFPCDFAKKSNEIDIYGTGGTILQGLKELLNNLPGLKRVELIDLQLIGVDAAHVLDEVSEVCCTRISSLKVVNISRLPFQMLAIVSFVNLKVLCISPHNIGDDIVECFGDMKKLRNVQIITNAYTESVAPPVDYRVWKACRKANPRLRVHLITEGKHRHEVTFQQRAPVKSVIYDSPYIKSNMLSIDLVVDQYGTDLECYAHKRLPRFKMPRSFHDRADSGYLYLVKQCPYLHTLMIRERISSATVLLLAYTGKNLRYFHVRRNAIILKCEWPQSPEWSHEFYKWLTKNCRNYDDMEREVSQILGFRWYALNDKQYKLTPLNLNIPYYYEGFDEAD